MDAALWVAQLSPFEAATWIIGFAIVLSVLCVILVGALFDPLISEASQVGSSNFGYIAEIYAVVLGLIAVVGFAEYQETRANLVNESALLRIVSTAVDGLPAGDSAVLRRHLRDYLEVTIAEEWPAMALGEASARAGAALDRLMQATYRVRPEAMPDMFTLAQLRDLLAELGTLRAQRITTSPDRNVMDVLVPVFGLTTMIAVLLGWFILGYSVYVQFAVSTLVIVVVLSIIYLSTILLFPFSSIIQLQPDDMRAVLDVVSRAN